MNKRRRAYKKYDWQKHCMYLLSKQLTTAEFMQIAKAIDIAILYGEDAIGWKESKLELSAGLWRITVPIREPYRKAVNE